jgi:predicted MFS family arabinose efflux permease
VIYLFSRVVESGEGNNNIVLRIDLLVLENKLSQVMIPVVMTSHGLAVMIGSRVVGRLADKYGVVPVISSLMIFCCIGGVFALLAITKYEGHVQVCVLNASTSKPIHASRLSISTLT